MYYPRNEEYSVDESYIRFSDGTSVKADSKSGFVFDYWMVKSLDDTESIIISSDGLLSKPIQFIAVFKEISPIESSREKYEAAVSERTYSTEFDETNGIDDELESSSSLNSIGDVEIDYEISIGENANYDCEEIISDRSNEISTIVLNEDVEEDSVVNEDEIEDIQIIDDVVDKIIPGVLSYSISNDIVDVNSLSSSGETIGPLDMEENAAETVIPSSPGFGEVSCFVLIGITMVLAFNRTKNE